MDYGLDRYVTNLILSFLTFTLPYLTLPYLVRITALNPATHSKRPVGLLSALQHSGMLHCFKLMESYLSSIFRRPSMLEYN